MVITFFIVSLLVGVTAFSGAATADMPDASQCSAISWTNQTISGQTYYEVDSLDKLQCLENQGLGNNYVLTEDINASETNSWNGGAGFDPIGDKNNEFTGTFDGSGYTVSGLTIDREGTYSVGLFSEVGSGGTITNVTLAGGFVTGTRRVGQLTGYNEGTIEDAHATGATTGHERVGGLVGRNDGTLRRSSVSGERTRGTDWIGGLVGFNQGAVNRSFAARTVVGEGGGFDGASAGGLVGVSTGTIAESYATGTVTASWYVGGLLGSFQMDSGGMVRRSYATGALSIDDETQGIGGLVGGSAVEPVTVEQAYWDVGTTNEETVSTGDGWNPITVTNVSSFGATADTDPAPEMQGTSAEANMPGLDFTNTWETVESEDTDAAADGYPILRSINRGDQLRAQGIAKPVVESVTRNSPTNRVTTSENVTFTVLFSESVSGVDASNFALTRTDSTPTANADSDVSVAGGDVRYVVSVTNISTDGTLRLDLVDDDSITDSDGNRLVEGGESGSADGSYTTGETFVIDTSAPVAMPTSNPNPADQNSPVSFDGSASTDTVGITSYLWDFGDGSPTATGPTPNHTYADPGTYTVTLNVSDVGGNTDTGALNVTVQKVGGGGGATWGSSNDAPSANNDSYSISAETRLDVTTESGLLANDSDPDDAVDSLSVSVVSDPMNGVLDLASDGSFTYTPTDGFTGRDSFTYEVSDEDGETDEATVTLTVQRTGDSERTILENASAIRQRFGVPANATPTYAERVSLPTNQSGPVSVNFTQNTTVSRIQFGADAEVRGNFTVVEFATSESVPKALPGQSLVAFQLTGSPPAENASATVQLQLPRADVRTAGAAATAIRVAHHANGTWRLLNTTVVNQTNRTVTVEATTTGFSPFSATLVGTPEATLSSMPTTVAVGEAFALDATESSTPYGALVRYEWSVAGRQQSGETVTMVLDQPGTYPVELTVTNDAGQTANVTETVVVEASEAAGASTPTDVVTSENVQGAASDNSTETPFSTDVDSPGFGLVGAVVAILLTVIAVRRQ
ncbi:PKD domain-containing protein [Haloferax sp. AB510]|uniref:PKD domain-containing protein n=1 Tax=Haloferax sp. AB510 TaxID=2934172 RepID=UPI00209C4B21|nr:PKD domain-containing protein [Haloferax sp. AB510]MCO8267143.1 PKD domain-containing protein [Haloferax sp. AB510]